MGHIADGLGQKHLPFPADGKVSSPGILEKMKSWFTFNSMLRRNRSTEERRKLGDEVVRAGK